MIKLIELLAKEEIYKIKIKYKNTKISYSHSYGLLDFNLKDLTFYDLTQISMILIRTKNKELMPKCVLGAEAINILTKRAIKLGLSIF